MLAASEVETGAGSPVMVDPLAIVMVLLNVDAPVTVSPPERVERPVTFKASLRVVAPVTPRVPPIVEFPVIAASPVTVRLLPLARVRFPVIESPEMLT